MCKQPDESLIGQYEHNTSQRFLLVSLLWYQKLVFGKFSILSKSLYLGLSFISIHQQFMLFWISIGCILIKITSEIKLVPETDLTAHQETVNYIIRIAWTVIGNIKESFMGNSGFLQTFICWMDCSQTIKNLLLDKFSI